MEPDEHQSDYEDASTPRIHDRIAKATQDQAIATNEEVVQQNEMLDHISIQVSDTDAVVQQQTQAAKKVVKKQRHIIHICIYIKMSASQSLQVTHDQAAESVPHPAALLQVVNPNASNPNEILNDTNYFLWEFNTRMALKATDVKVLAELAKLLSPIYQSAIREASSALETWEILRAFFAKQNLHNRVQLHKQLHEFSMGAGENLMEHILQFDDMSLRLCAVGDKLSEDETLDTFGESSVGI
ncbi:polyprotein, partial [Globisporangium splendens]